jgi:hypothetical protein
VQFGGADALPNTRVDVLLLRANDLRIDANSSAMMD